MVVKMLDNSYNQICKIVDTFEYGKTRYYCPFCDMSYLTLFGLFAHINSRHKKTCLHCVKQFSYRDKLVAHLYVLFNKIQNKNMYPYLVVNDKERVLISAYIQGSHIIRKLIRKKYPSTITLIKYILSDPERAKQYFFNKH